MSRVTGTLRGIRSRTPSLFLLGFLAKNGDIPGPSPLYGCAPDDD